jgi:hypothetical protein
MSGGGLSINIRYNVLLLYWKYTIPDTKYVVLSVETNARYVVLSVETNARYVVLSVETNARYVGYSSLVGDIILKRFMK